MSQLLFYLGYALRNLWRSRRWSAFAVFSVAAGVATMVAFRSLGLSIGDSLVGDVRNSNKGDITISIPGDGFASTLGDPDKAENFFTETELATVRQWAAENNARTTEYRLRSGLQVAKLDAVTVGRLQFISSFFIDPDTYPVTDPILSDEPPNMPLGELLTAPTDIVISRNLADSAQIHVGDTVRVSGSEVLFTVKGIVPTAAQAGLQQLGSREIFSLFFGFAYFDRAAVGELLNTSDGANRIGINLPDGASAEDIYTADGELTDLLQADSDWSRFNSVNAPSLASSFTAISDILGRFIVVLGLGAMLLGGVGIINTMLVLVRRRTDEIAALKTFGLKGRQVAAMFLAEAFWLGVFGSLLGGVLGVLLSGVANRFGADLIQQPLKFKVYPEAILFGFGLGVVVAMVFGVLPVLSAARVRPASILRPNDSTPVNAGCFSSILVVIFVVLALGLIAGQIITVWWAGVLGVAITLLILFILAMLLWCVVWLLGKLPAFGNVDLNLALRNLTTQRMRTATTLLALSAGMFALSSIALFGEGAREILRFTFSDALGGNIIIFPLLPQQIAAPIIDARLNTLNGVESRTRIHQISSYVSELNGERVFDDRRRFDPSSGIIIRDTTDANFTIPNIMAGRSLTFADRGQPVAVFQLPQFTDPTEEEEPIRYAVGDIVTLTSYNNDFNVQVEVVGVAGASSNAGFGGFMLPLDLISTNDSDFTLNLIKVSPENLNEVLLGLSSIPLILTFDISFFDGILQRLITQFSALPLVVGLFSLGAAAVINANTVALSILERRRQIGVLRAVGLKGGRVLRVLILENVIVCLLGGVIGIGLSALGVFIMTRYGLDAAILIPANAMPVAVGLILISVLIGVLATLASGAMAVRERITNTLRYE